MTPTDFHVWADLLPEPLLLVSGGGTVLAANRSAADEFGLGQTCGKRLGELSTGSPEKIDEYLLACSRNRQLIPGSLALRLGGPEPARFHCEGSLLVAHEDRAHRRILLRLRPRESGIRQFVALNHKIEELAREIDRRERIEADLLREREQLRISDERLRIALEAGRMGTWEWIIATGEVIWSPTLERIHGREPGTFPGTFEAYQEDIHPDDRPWVLDRIRETVASGREHQVEYRLVRPDGSVHWVESRGRLFYDAEGRPARMQGVCMDVDQRKRAENVARFLADASRSLAALVDYESTLRIVARLAVPFFADWCVVHLAQDDGSLRQLAAAHVEPAKVRLAEELGRRYPPDSDSPFGAAHVYRTGRPEMAVEVTEEMLAAEARDPEHLQMLRALHSRSYLCVPLTVWGKVLGTISFLSAESGRHYDGADLAVAEDLAYRAAIAIENARLYKELRETDRRKDEFLAMLAHELRNPLGPIRTGLDLLALGGVERDTVGLMQRQVEHLVRLVDDLLDVSRIMRGKIQLRCEPVELADVVRRAVEVARPLVDRQRHRLEVSLPPEPVWLDADPVRLAQVVANLLNNAAKYTEPGGRIELEAHRDGNRAVIAVRDNGLGISPDLLPRVFDLFTQADRSLERSQGGLGIGLTLVRSLVEMHGGTVVAESDGEGQGSRFTVFLPVPQQIQARAPRNGPRGPVRSRRILVVEDNVGMATMLRRLLEKLGSHEVHTAHDGREALLAAREHRPEIVFLDIGLPRMNGYEVARRLRQQPEFQTTVLVALTGYGMEEDRRRSHEAGFDRHLVKPPSIDGLYEVLADPELAER